MKNLYRLNILAVLLLSFPAFAVDGMAVIDMRTAVLSTQAAADAFKALEEDADYAANLEEAQSLQAKDRPLLKNSKKILKHYPKLK
jgi:outer membrane protein